MADPRRQENRDWEGNTAQVSLAGVRLLVQSTIAPISGGTASYTITHATTKRVILFHTTCDLNIRVNQNATATSSHLPVAAGMYFVLDMIKGEVVHVFNTGPDTVTINIVEIQ